MAWRPYRNLIEGELDNTVPGEVTGWMKFAGMKETVRLSLTGDFADDIRGTRIHLSNPSPGNQNGDSSYMRGFSPIQTGYAGLITAGLPPQDDVRHPYIEWHSDQNARVVLELDPSQVQVIGDPIPWNQFETDVPDHTAYCGEEDPVHA